MSIISDIFKYYLKDVLKLSEEVVDIELDRVRSYIGSKISDLKKQNNKIPKKLSIQKQQTAPSQELEDPDQDAMATNTENSEKIDIDETEFSDHELNDFDTENVIETDGNDKEENDKGENSEGENDEGDIDDGEIDEGVIDEGEIDERKASVDPKGSEEIEFDFDELNDAEKAKKLIDEVNFEEVREIVKKIEMVDDSTNSTFVEKKILKKFFCEKNGLLLNENNNNDITITVKRQKLEN